ncbi:alkaline phosphatase family protein [Maribacter sp. 1_MG-2023]|uniref:alkaline phosphatase family protein n=1 Tax=Maribacter sp. 1_MG-2023 TaxID=3062677 RepID=UPI0026E380F7|nr:alkaline phosphatase family protein [Maribacter sp. 1_MG-2023]MDO6473739.1 alkaline phosphatase family protein [Maribacter sp. 1_MG-2023]
MKIIQTSILFSSALLFFSTQSIFCHANSKPKLVLQITVDQLRADLPNTVFDRLPEGGFKYLYNQGIVYQNAQHGHANTETVVGHTTLATGANPSEHGMIGNLWYDKELKRSIYNVEDYRYPLIGSGAGVDKNTEVDPTQAAASTDGRSPSAIISTTFSDELAMSTNGKAKIFGVSVKDRGAITMAGHAGKAFWFSKAKGQFVSSSYYYDEYPSWVNKWNSKEVYKSYANTSWQLTNDISTYIHGEEDDMPYETKFPGYGVVFPHNFGNADNKYFTTFLTLSPAGDEITLDFAKALFESEKLGLDNITDYLSISFSCTDYVGHVFGPSSLEAEDNLFKLDRTLADLIKFVDDKIGLDNVLIVLSADHGAPDVPERLKTIGVDAGYFDLDSVDTLSIQSVIEKKFKISEKVVSGYFHPYVYLDNEVIEKYNLDLDEVSRTLAKELQKQEGIAFAIPSIDLLEGKISRTKLTTSILNNYNPKRSGEIYIVTEPYWFVNDMDGLTVASHHGSPWKYDTSVPVIFAGNGLKKQTIYRTIQTTDVALTLSNYLNIKIPSGSSGEPLLEVLKKLK